MTLFPAHRHSGIDSPIQRITTTCTEVAEHSVWVQEQHDEEAKRNNKKKVFLVDTSEVLCKNGKSWQRE
ncbi:MAG: hypothetical protein COA78_17020 [Blastopirellula sp.]|nr:MAG: hypothetical protein COA78_17020 [Blastopirellula sp.]